MVMGNHVRTNPAFKDVFAHSEFLSIGLGDAWSLTLAIHQIANSEMDDQRRIAPNYQNGGFGGDIPGHFVGTLLNGQTREQLAIDIRQDLTHNHLVPGDNAVAITDAQKSTTWPYPAELGPPWTIGPDAINVYTYIIMLVSPTHRDINTEDRFDAAAIAQTIAHEVGHTLAIDHVDYYNMCPPYAVTVMATRYYNTSTSAGDDDCSWNHIPYLYTETDFLQMRVR
jgi:hypothetical protein